jgi:hypothetical protein
MSSTGAAKHDRSYLDREPCEGEVLLLSTLAKRTGEATRRLLLDPEIETAGRVGHLDAGRVEGALKGRVYTIEDTPSILVRFDPPSYPEHHGRVAHLVVERIHGAARQDALHMPHSTDDEMARLIQSSALKSRGSLSASPVEAVN